MVFLPWPIYSYISEQRTKPEPIWDMQNWLQYTDFHPKPMTRGTSTSMIVLFYMPPKASCGEATNPHH